jgi:hypothetical protein
MKETWKKHPIHTYLIAIPNENEGYDVSTFQKKLEATSNAVLFTIAKHQTYYTQIAMRCPVEPAEDEMTRDPCGIVQTSSSAQSAKE